MYVTKSEHGFLPLHSYDKFVHTKCKQLATGWSQCFLFTKNVTTWTMSNNIVMFQPFHNVGQLSKTLSTDEPLHGGSYAPGSLQN